MRYRAVVSVAGPSLTSTLSVIHSAFIVTGMDEDWFLLRSGLGLAAENMAVDEALLDACPQLGRPVLRFYGWKEAAASFGYSQKYADAERWTKLRPLIRRPTGGGLVPHEADWTYSLVYPANHWWYGLRATESYRRVHEWLRHAFERLGVAATLSVRSERGAPGQCFVGAEQFDLLRGGRKVAGAAQRRLRQGLLVQGSVQAGKAVSRVDWESGMLTGWPFAGKISWSSLTLDERLCERVAELVREKYSQSAYNQRR